MIRSLQSNAGEDMSTYAWTCFLQYDIAQLLYIYKHRLANPTVSPSSKYPSSPQRMTRNPY